MSDAHGVYARGSERKQEMVDWFKQQFGYKGAQKVWDELNAERLGITVEELDFPYKWMYGHNADPTKYEEFV